MVYLQTGSYEETARRVQLDRRTVKSKIDEQFAVRMEEREIRSELYHIRPTS